MTEYIALLAIAMRRLPQIADIVKRALDVGEIEEPLATEIRKVLPAKSESGKLVEELSHVT